MPPREPSFLVNTLEGTQYKDTGDVMKRCICKVHTLDGILLMPKKVLYYALEGIPFRELTP